MELSDKIVLVVRDSDKLFDDSGGGIKESKDKGVLFEIILLI